MFQNNKNKNGENTTSSEPSSSSEDAFANDLNVDFGDAMNQSPEDGSFGTKEARPTSELSKISQELAETKDRLYRTYAELENFRKRSARELADELKYANMTLFRDILPVLDNLQRAIESAEKHSQQDQLTSVGEALLQGVRMVCQQFSDVLARHDCIKIDALGQQFDPKYHQAITQMPSADVEPNTVTIETQTGYTLFERVVRPSQVVVSTAVAPTGNE